MLFNSIDFLIFYCAVFVGYYLLPGKLRFLWLLAASILFYMNWNRLYILLLLGCILVTYVTAILIEQTRGKANNGGRNPDRMWVAICTVILLGTLAVFKYLNFGAQQINRLLLLLRVPPITSLPELLLPVGISFFVLQSLGYVIDVYRGEIEAEKNPLRYALFISFFPQLVAGPIERSKNLLGQMREPKHFSYDNLRKGLLLALWGLFCKIVIADRIAIFIDAVYADPDTYGGLYIVFAALLFPLQLYCDFYGYSTIARGTALMLGFTLMDNFAAPYFSVNIREFWRRWHISLSGWFRDYLYVPLGGNRRGMVRKELNLLIVFGLSGLWHGASMGFVVWGLLNGFYQVVGDVLRRLHRGEKKPMPFSGRLWRCARTFVLVSFSMIFFRAGDYGRALVAIDRMCTDFHLGVLTDGSLFTLGVSGKMFGVTGLAVLALATVDCLKYQGKDVAALVLKQEWWFRALCGAALVMVLLLFGCYGEMYDTQQFIYFQF